MTTTLRAFHGDKKIKAMYLQRVRAHAAADQLIHGVYWEAGRGCAVGCTIHSADHGAYETELGIPAQLAQLEDAIFEALENGEAQTWPDRFLSAIPVNADLSGVWPAFAAWLMDDATYGVAHATEDADIKELCLEVARRYRAGETTGAEAEALADRLWEAREVWSARTAAAAWAARAAASAWEAREVWEARAATETREVWAARAAREAWEAYSQFAHASASELLTLLAAAPVTDARAVGMAVSEEEGSLCAQCGNVHGGPRCLDEDAMAGVDR